MNQKIIVERLKTWRNLKARQENCEVFRVLSNQTIDTIASNLPKNKRELMSIKGIKEKKFNKYGKEILSLTKDHSKENKTDYSSNNTLFSNVSQIREESNGQKDRVYSISDFLDLVNQNLVQIRTGIRGEITSLDFRNNYLFFSLKDKKDESLVSCFMWRNDYELGGGEIKEGQEIIAYGIPEIYKRSGRFTFKADMIELFGEGVLKKAYEELKKRLEEEGLFEKERKKALPKYPSKIGLITSRDGAVINDFLNNIGRFGYKITFYDSRVEGVMAVKDLIKAVKFFKEKEIDVLVIIRGGGSLESLQAFNNESLIREILSLKVPLMVGIGHDKDVPLLSFVSDSAHSTPSIVAREINNSWEKGLDKIDSLEKEIINSFDLTMNESRFMLEKTGKEIESFFRNIFLLFKEKELLLNNAFVYLTQSIKENKVKRDQALDLIFFQFKEYLNKISISINNWAKELKNNDPNRQLKLGYSIVTLDNKIIKSIEEVKKGSIIINRLSDGKVISKVK